MSKTGYVNGSDMLLMVGEKAIGHCTTHSVSMTAETKERTVKPVASAAQSTALFKDKGIVSLSVSISAEGLRYYGESENGYEALMGLMTSASAVTVKCFERGGDTKPYLTGSFVITKLDATMPVNDDVTFSIDLESTGVVTDDSTAFSSSEA